jgi:flagellar protein FliJ
MFVFPLQSVLNYRKNIEEKILNEFSEKKRELETEESRLNNMINERNNLIGELRKMQNKLLHIDDIAGLVSYVEQVRVKEMNQKQVIVRAAEQLESKRTQLLDAVKKKKVMEKLRERHAEEYESNERDLERKNSDEMAVLKFGRREK